MIPLLTWSRRSLWKRQQRVRCCRPHPLASSPSAPTVKRRQMWVEGRPRFQTGNTIHQTEGNTAPTLTVVSLQCYCCICIYCLISTSTPHARNLPEWEFSSLASKYGSFLFYLVKITKRLYCKLYGACRCSGQSSWRQPLVSAHFWTEAKGGARKESPPSAAQSTPSPQSQSPAPAAASSSPATPVHDTKHIRHSTSSGTHRLHTNQSVACSNPPTACPSPSLSAARDSLLCRQPRPHSLPDSGRNVRWDSFCCRTRILSLQQTACIPSLPFLKLRLDCFLSTLSKCVLANTILWLVAWSTVEYFYVSLCFIVDCDI